MRELAGGFWIPILLLLVLREGKARDSERTSLLRRVFGGSALGLALVIAGAWLSNAPVGVMASYLLAAMALTVAIVSRSWMPVLAVDCRRRTRARACGLLPGSGGVGTALGRYPTRLRTTRDS